MKIQTKFTYAETETPDKWVEFFPIFCSSGIQLNVAGYFDARPHIVTNLATIISGSLVVAGVFAGFPWWYLLIIFLAGCYTGWGQIFISLPINTGRVECEGDTYGIEFQRIDSRFPTPPDSLVVQWGSTQNINNKFQYASFYMPWTLKFYRHSMLLKDDTWVHDIDHKKDQILVDGKRTPFYEHYWDDKKKRFYYDYTDPYDGETIPTIISVEEREYRRRGLLGLPWFRRVHRYIEVSFDKEVGSEKGSWKGGTVGCSYDMKPGEQPMDTLKRMESERKFDR